MPPTETQEDQWLTIRHMQRITERRRSEQDDIVEMRGDPWAPAVAQKMQQHGGCNADKKAKTAA